MECGYNQKEGNGNINMGLFAQFSQEIVLTSEMIHHKSRELLALRNGVDRAQRKKTYTDDGWVIGHRRLVLFWRCRGLLNPQVFHIAASKHDEVVDLIGSRDFLLGIILSALGAMRLHALQGNSRLG